MPIWLAGARAANTLAPPLSWSLNKTLKVLSQSVYIKCKMATFFSGSRCINSLYILLLNKTGCAVVHSVWFVLLSRLNSTVGRILATMMTIGQPRPVVTACDCAVLVLKRSRYRMYIHTDTVVVMSIIQRFYHGRPRRNFQLEGQILFTSILQSVTDSLLRILRTRIRGLMVNRPCTTDTKIL